MLEVPGMLKSPGVLDTTEVLTPSDITGTGTLELVLENIGVLLAEMAGSDAILELEAMPEGRAVLVPGAVLEERVVLKPGGLPEAGATLELWVKAEALETKRTLLVP